MTRSILYADAPEKWPRWEAPLRTALADQNITLPLTTSTDAPENVAYIVYSPSSGMTDFTPFTGLAAVFSTWAGVERIVTNPTLTVPLTRMVDPGLGAGMVEYVVAHALRYHLGLDAILAGQDGVWRPGAPRLASERTVAILGFGALGAACAAGLAGLGFNVIGWGRRPKPDATLPYRHGQAGLFETLAKADIAVSLLPETEATTNILGQAAFDAAKPGLALINAGRGPVIDDEALISALDSGKLSGATLDVFRTEPLPPEHPFWSHPKVIVTSHIAAETRPETAAGVIAENIRRAEAGAPLLHLVDRSVGY